MKRLRLGLIATAAGTIALGFFASVPNAARAATTWNTGDLVLGVASGNFQVRAPDGTLRETLNDGGSGFTTGCAFDSAQNLYGTGFNNNLVAKFAGPNPPHTLSTFGSGYSTPESIAFDAAGNVYVGNLGNGIRQYDPTGTFVKNIISARVDWFDIAADQDTILYTDEGTNIKRVSISTATSLPNFTTGTAIHAYALRILSDGGVLLADQNDVKRYDSTGAVVQHYDVTGENSWFSLNLDPNGTSFWAGNFSSANYYEFNIASGAQEAGPFNTGTGPGTLFGICLLGEITVATQELQLAPATATNAAGTAHTVTAKVASNGIPAAGVLVSFSVTAGPNTGAASVPGDGNCATNADCTTDAAGEVSWTYTSNGTPGTDTIQACFTNDSSNQVCKSVTKTWTGAATTLTYSGDTTSDFNDTASLSAVLTTASGPVVGESVDFTLNGTETCSGTTDATGTATCTVIPQEAPGTYTVSASFGGNAGNGLLESNTTASFVVTQEEAALSSSTSLLLFSAGGSASLSAVLTDPDGGAPIAGKSVTITLGSGAGSQSCSGTTDATGTATCSISPVTVALGPQPVTDSFAGDTYYESATNAQNALVFAYLARGSFVIGDKNATIGNSVSFFVNPLDVSWWTAKWWKLNKLTGGNAPSAFKGFANSLSSTPPRCGGTYTTNTGNSSGPPSSVPSYMAVLVSSRITQSGSIVSGNIPEIVIVKTNTGYNPNPGHAGTGTVVAVLCKN